MKIIVVIAQRKCRYEGEYAPEALACISEYGQEENPDFITDTLSENRNCEEFDAVEPVCFEVDGKAIDAALFPNRNPIKAEIVKEPK